MVNEGEQVKAQKQTSQPEQQAPQHQWRLQHQEIKFTDTAYFTQTALNINAFFSGFSLEGFRTQDNFDIPHTYAKPRMIRPNCSSCVCETATHTCVPMFRTHLGSVLRASRSCTLRCKVKTCVRPRQLEPRWPSASTRSQTRCCASSPSATVGWQDFKSPVAYGEALVLQRDLRTKIQEGAAGDVCLCLEHEPVYTLGRVASEENVLRDTPETANIDVVRVERGGEVTYHGPGQVVVYFLLDLHRHRKDLRWFVTCVEEVVIRTLGEFGVDGRRESGLPGVWVGDEKVAAVGISVSKWATMHGLSINVNPNMAHFGGIVPCGIEDRGVTSLELLLADSADREPVTVDDVKAVLREKVAEVFGVHVEDAPAQRSASEEA